MQTWRPQADQRVLSLGDVPEGWEIARLKNDLSFLTSGSRGWAEHYSDDGALFLRIGNLPREAIKLDLSDIQRVSVPEGSEGQRTRVETGDVLFSITAYLGSVAVVPANLEVAYVSQHVALARLKHVRMLPAWVAYVTLSVVGKTYLAEQGYGGTKVQLSLDDVANLIVPVPPKHEQQEILAYLEEQTLKLDTLTAAAEASIVLLQERRAALISAAVTGKIDVRSEQPATITEPDNQDICMAVAATIIARLWKMPTFGRVKNQKVVYLAEAYAGIAEFHGNYLREAAGPLDRALLRNLECGLERAGTIAVQQPRGIGTAVTYRFTGDSASIKKTLKMQLGARLERLERLIDAVCDLDTRSIEAVATLYAAWNDILIEGLAPTDDEVVLEVLENWHPEKQVKFTPADLHRWLAWMRRKLIVPDGTGPKTVTGRLFA